jgi:predicted metalloprotease with PDZ domain
MLLESMKSMLEASARFLGGLPVDRYVFLYHFENAPGPAMSYGAWEHSYSSEYTMPDAPYTDGYAGSLVDVAAHEFLHIVTPLNIHSEIIEHFNFETPVPSRHLWLYEGTTEWEAHAAQMRGGLKTPQAFLDEMARKIMADRMYDASYSLEKLALTSYTEEGQRQYGNIYMRGALVASLLDIRLLELSDGKMGLQQLIRRLMQRYGKSKPFPDDGLYDAITAMTYPEINDFFAKYVRAAEPLPIAEYYGKLGITYVDGATPSFTIDADPSPGQAKLRAAWEREDGAGR